MAEQRIEKDTFGDIAVAADRLWGAQTQRSLHHFDISTEQMPRRADPRARAGQAQRRRRQPRARHARRRARPTRSSPPPTRCSPAGTTTQFPLSVWQTGSGTQTNMNMNEVLANRASQLLGGPVGEGRLVHPNDDVNRSQSSNDVFPTAMNVAAVEALATRAAAGGRSAARHARARRPREFADDRQDRPHPPAGRDAADARPGDLGLGRAARPRHGARARRRCRTCASSRSAARRSAPA